MTDWERIGGEPAVTAMMTRFIDRVFDDMIIGFLFIGRDRERIIRHEVQLASVHLGGEATYGGRPLASLHRPLKINAGQFRRRLALLTQELQASGVPADIAERWISHDRKMERAITDGTDCTPDDQSPPN